MHRATVFKVFAAIAVISFLLRIFYTGHLYQDDGMWFTVGEELARGKVLYRDVYFDKPPALALVYAALFKLFGAHVLTIRLFTILYAIAVSATLYVFGRRLYGERTGLTAALMFTVFSTIFTTGHVQGLNTDLLMALPYTAGACWLLCARGDVFGDRVTGRQRARFALAGGASVSLAAQANPKGVFDLVFFALFLLLAYLWRRREETRGGGEAETRRDEERPAQPSVPYGAFSPRPRLPASSFLLFSFALIGFVAAALPFLIYVAASGALPFYWRYVWDWGARYAAYYPTSYVISMALGQTAMYFLLNSPLLIALLFVAVTTYRRARRAATTGAEKAVGADFEAEAIFRADAALLLWLAVSFVAMSVGGRFFGHYFFQILPPLCLIGARGVLGLLAARRRERQVGPSPSGGAGHGREGQRAVWAYVVLAVLVVGFAVTLVRFHTRTVVLAADWLRGTSGAASRRWFHERLKTEERLVAAVVNHLETEPPEAVEQLGLEAMRRGGPRQRPPEGPSDYLFVWGYRPEIYYWSGLLPASKYLSTQMLTGVPADVHYFSHDYRPVLDERDTAAARQELAQELARTRPEYIVDELGFFNADLAMARYGELSEVLSGYKNIGSVGRFLLYRRRDFIKAGKREKGKKKASEGVKE